MVRKIPRKPKSSGKSADDYKTGAHLSGRGFVRHVQICHVGRVIMLFAFHATRLLPATGHWPPSRACLGSVTPHHEPNNTTMSHLSIQIRRHLVSQGWAVFDSESARETRATLEELGDVVQRVRIGHEADRRTAAVPDESMRLHSAHPRIRWVAWHCVCEAPGKASILVSHAANSFWSLPKGTQEALRQTTMGFSSAFDGDPERCPVARDAFGVSDWLFFAPWFWREGADEHLDAFVEKLRMMPADRVHLAPGQVLLIDNARVLHGFEPTPAARQTLLLRHWVAASHQE